MRMIKHIALILAIIGALNWGLIGFFQFDLVAAIFGGQDAALSRIIYGLVGISGLICLTILFEMIREMNAENSRMMDSNELNVSTEFGEEMDINKEKSDQEK